MDESSYFWKRKDLNNMIMGGKVSANLRLFMFQVVLFIFI